MPYFITANLRICVAGLLPGTGSQICLIVYKDVNFNYFPSHQHSFVIKFYACATKLLFYLLIRPNDVISLSESLQEDVFQRVSNQYVCAELRAKLRVNCIDFRD